MLQDTFVVLVAGFIILGLFYLVVFGFMYLKPYLIIENGILTKNGLIPKKIKLSEIDQIKKLQGEIILKTKENSLKINTYYIDTKSLQDLLRILDAKR